jgi:hypothetical protein
MKVIKIVKSEKKYHSVIYNDLVTEVIDEASFNDLYDKFLSSNSSKKTRI